MYSDGSFRIRDDQGNWIFDRPLAGTDIARITSGQRVPLGMMCIWVRDGAISDGPHQFLLEFEDDHVPRLVVSSLLPNEHRAGVVKTHGRFYINLVIPLHTNLADDVSGQS
jgi:hypothetical protein